MIVGLTGKKQHGKSTVAQHLVENYGFVEMSFAAALKRFLADLLDVPVELLNDEKERSKILRPYGKSLRVIMQEFGTDYVREKLHPDFWVLKVAGAYKRRKSSHPKGKPFNVVFSDVRFDNEAHAIRALDPGSKVIKVVKTDADGIPIDDSDTHASEKGVDFGILDCVFLAETGDTGRLVQLATDYLGLDDAGASE
jgi:hypothetical protein